MEISEKKRSEAVIVSVSGRVDATNAPNLEQRLLGLIDGGERCLVVDCGRLDYISSAGLRALLVALKRLKTAGGKMAVGSLKDDIREVFDIAGFSSILSVYPNLEEALAKM
jgi:anti-sigma B factor antagonist